MKEIPLTRGLVAIVDDHDFEELSQHKWNAQKGKYTFYAVRTDGAKAILMHRQILGLSERSAFTDHINGNGLDNRRENIRLCSVSENNRNKRGYKNNSSGMKGVRVCGKKWLARITYNKKVIYLGLFKDKETAIKAYNEAALSIHGEFAFLNET